ECGFTTNILEKCSFSHLVQMNVNQTLIVSLPFVYSGRTKHTIRSEGLPSFYQKAVQVVQQFKNPKSVPFPYSKSENSRSYNLC
ncbi:hypothetical protein STEG23_005063, partial [Scotinomys teguina]